MSADINIVVLSQTSPSKRLDVCISRDVELRLTNPDDQGLGNLEVNVSGRSQLLEGFCGRGNSNGPQDAYPAEVAYITSDRDDTVILLGITDVCVINKRGDICKVLRLFRSEDDDRSFYTPFRILDNSDFCVIYYESGIFRLTSDGLVTWHTRLAYDDVLMDQTKHEAIFINEHVRDGTPWKLFLADGTIAS